MTFKWFRMFFQPMHSDLRQIYLRRSALQSKSIYKSTKHSRFSAVTSLNKLELAKHNAKVFGQISRGMSLHTDAPDRGGGTPNSKKQRRLNSRCLITGYAAKRKLRGLYLEQRRRHSQLTYLQDACKDDICTNIKRHLMAGSIAGYSQFRSNINEPYLQSLTKKSKHGNDDSIKAGSSRDLEPYRRSQKLRIGRKLSSKLSKFGGLMSATARPHYGQPTPRAFSTQLSFNQMADINQEKVKESEKRKSKEEELSKEEISKEKSPLKEKPIANEKVSKEMVPIKDECKALKVRNKDKDKNTLKNTSYHLTVNPNNGKLDISSFFYEDLLIKRARDYLDKGGHIRKFPSFVLDALGYPKITSSLELKKKKKDKSKKVVHNCDYKRFLVHKPLVKNDSGHGGKLQALFKINDIRNMSIPKPLMIQSVRTNKLEKKCSKDILKKSQAYHSLEESTKSIKELPGPQKRRKSMEHSPVKPKELAVKPSYTTTKCLKSVAPSLNLDSKSELDEYEVIQPIGYGQFSKAEYKSFAEMIKDQNLRCLLPKMSKRFKIKYPKCRNESADLKASNKGDTKTQLQQKNVTHLERKSQDGNDSDDNAGGHGVMSGDGGVPPSNPGGYLLQEVQRPLKLPPKSKKKESAATKVSIVRETVTVKKVNSKNEIVNLKVYGGQQVHSAAEELKCTCCKPPPPITTNNYENIIAKRRLKSKENLSRHISIASRIPKMQPLVKKPMVQAPRNNTPLGNQSQHISLTKPDPYSSTARKLFRPNSENTLVPANLPPKRFSTSHIPILRRSVKLKKAYSTDGLTRARNRQRGIKTYRLDRNHELEDELLSNLELQTIESEVQQSAVVDDGVKQGEDTISKNVSLKKSSKEVKSEEDTKKLDLIDDFKECSKSLKTLKDSKIEGGYKFEPQNLYDIAQKCTSTKKISERTFKTPIVGNKTWLSPYDHSGLLHPGSLALHKTAVFDMIRVPDTRSIKAMHSHRTFSTTMAQKGHYDSSPDDFLNVCKYCGVIHKNNKESCPLREALKLFEKPTIRPVPFKLITLPNNSRNDLLRKSLKNIETKLVPFNTSTRLSQNKLLFRKPVVSIGGTRRERCEPKLRSRVMKPIQRAPTKNLVRKRPVKGDDIKKFKKNLSELLKDLLRECHQVLNLNKDSRIIHGRMQFVIVEPKNKVPKFKDGDSGVGEPSGQDPGNKTRGKQGNDPSNAANGAVMISNGGNCLNVVPEDTRNFKVGLAKLGTSDKIVLNPSLEDAPLSGRRTHTRSNNRNFNTCSRMNAKSKIMVHEEKSKDAKTKQPTGSNRVKVCYSPKFSDPRVQENWKKYQAMHAIAMNERSKDREPKINVRIESPMQTPKQRDYLVNIECTKLANQQDHKEIHRPRFGTSQVPNRSEHITNVRRISSEHQPKRKDTNKTMTFRKAIDETKSDHVLNASKNAASTRQNHTSRPPRDIIPNNRPQRRTGTPAIAEKLKTCSSECQHLRPSCESRAAKSISTDNCCIASRARRLEESEIVGRNNRFVTNNIINREPGRKVNVGGNSTTSKELLATTSAYRMPFQRKSSRFVSNTTSYMKDGGHFKEYADPELPKKCTAKSKPSKCRPASQDERECKTPTREQPETSSMECCSCDGVSKKSYPRKLCAKNRNFKEALTDALNLPSCCEMEHIQARVRREKEKYRQSCKEEEFYTGYKGGEHKSTIDLVCHEICIREEALPMKTPKKPEEDCICPPPVKKPCKDPSNVKKEEEPEKKCVKPEEEVALCKYEPPCEEECEPSGPAAKITEFLTEARNKLHDLLNTNSSEAPEPKVPRNTKEKMMMRGWCDADCKSLRSERRHDCRMPDDEGSRMGEVTKSLEKCSIVEEPPCLIEKPVVPKCKEPERVEKAKKLDTACKYVPAANLKSRKHCASSERPKPRERCKCTVPEVDRSDKENEKPKCSSLERGRSTKKRQVCEDIEEDVEELGSRSERRHREKVKCSSLDRERPKCHYLDKDGSKVFHPERCLEKVGKEDDVEEEMDEGHTKRRERTKCGEVERPKCHYLEKERSEKSKCRLEKERVKCEKVKPREEPICEDLEEDIDEVRSNPDREKSKKGLCEPERPLCHYLDKEKSKCKPSEKERSKCYNIERDEVKCSQKVRPKEEPVCKNVEEDKEEVICEESPRKKLVKPECKTKESNYEAVKRLRPKCDTPREDVSSCKPKYADIQKMKLQRMKRRAYESTAYEKRESDNKVLKFRTDSLGSLVCKDINQSKDKKDLRCRTDSQEVKIRDERKFDLCPSQRKHGVNVAEDCDKPKSSCVVSSPKYCYNITKRSPKPPVRDLGVKLCPEIGALQKKSTTQSIGMCYQRPRAEDERSNQTIRMSSSCERKSVETKRPSTCSKAESIEEEKDKKSVCQKSCAGSIISSEQLDLICRKVIDEIQTRGAIQIAEPYSEKGLTVPPKPAENEINPSSSHLQQCLQEVRKCLDDYRKCLVDFNLLPQMDKHFDSFNSKVTNSTPTLAVGRNSRGSAGSDGGCPPQEASPRSKSCSRLDNTSRKEFAMQVNEESFRSKHQVEGTRGDSRGSQRCESPKRTRRSSEESTSGQNYRSLLKKRGCTEITERRIECCPTTGLIYEDVAILTLPSGKNKGYMAKASISSIKSTEKNSTHTIRRWKTCRKMCYIDPSLQQDRTYMARHSDGTPLRYANKGNHDKCLEKLDEICLRTGRTRKLSMLRDVKRKPVRSMRAVDYQSVYYPGTEKDVNVRHHYTGNQSDKEEESYEIETPSQEACSICDSKKHPLVEENPTGECSVPFALPPPPTTTSTFPVPPIPKSIPQVQYNYAVLQKPICLKTRHRNLGYVLSAPSSRHHRDTRLRSAAPSENLSQSLGRTEASDGDDDTLRVRSTRRREHQLRKPVVRDCLHRCHHLKVQSSRPRMKYRFVPKDSEHRDYGKYEYCKVDIPENPMPHRGVISILKNGLNEFMGSYSNPEATGPRERRLT